MLIDDDKYKDDEYIPMSDDYAFNTKSKLEKILDSVVFTLLIFLGLGMTGYTLFRFAKG